MTFAERMKAADAGQYYTTAQFSEWLGEVLRDYDERKRPKCRKVTNKTSGDSARYLDLACAFDIETTNYTNRSGEDRATMYIWMFGIEGLVIVGRTWAEFVILIKMLAQTFGLGKDGLRLLVGVHNLGFEFQFIRGLFRWTHIFARATREPLYAVNEYGIEFRDTLALTMMSLESVGSELTRYKVTKRVGDLDYSKIRNSYTDLTPQEMGYCINDVLVVMALLRERSETDGGLNRIPLTATGYARRHCREQCLPANRGTAYYNYRKLMQTLTLSTVEYLLIKKSFQGGFTHSNPWYVNRTVRDIRSYDFTSSYPAVLCFEKYPMSKGIEINPRALTPELFNGILKKYGVIMTVTLYDLESRDTNEFYLSSYKCEEEENVVSSNGRIVSADVIRTTVTSVDWEIIKQTYKFGKMVVNAMIVYKMDYLPTPFVRTILELYANKTQLKSIPSEEERYGRLKSLLNALYGMTATDICRPVISYTDDWLEEEPNIQAAVDEYNKDEQRFISYAWSTFCTAYARRNLWSGITACGSDYVYSDTDSIKIRNADRHLSYIAAYNEEIKHKAMMMCAAKNIPYALCVPKTVKGEEKPLGYWDYDGDYTMFRTLGAKRYMTAKADRMSLTISGVDKKRAVPYLLKEYGSIDSAFEHFVDGMYFPAGTCGKTIVKYIDEPFEEELTDYQGHTATVSEQACVHISEGDYTLGLTGTFQNFLRQLTSGYVELPMRYR